MNVLMKISSKKHVIIKLKYHGAGEIPASKGNKMIESIVFMVALSLIFIVDKFFDWYHNWKFENDDDYRYQQIHLSDYGTYCDFDDNCMCRQIDDCYPDDEQY